MKLDNFFTWFELGITLPTFYDYKFYKTWTHFRHRFIGCKRLEEDEKEEEKQQIICIDIKISRCTLTIFLFSSMWIV